VGPFKVWFFHETKGFEGTIAACRAFFDVAVSCFWSSRLNSERCDDSASGHLHRVSDGGLKSNFVRGYMIGGQDRHDGVGVASSNHSVCPRNAGGCIASGGFGKDVFRGQKGEALARVLHEMGTGGNQDIGWGDDSGHPPHGSEQQGFGGVGAQGKELFRISMARGGPEASSGPTGHDDREMAGRHSFPQIRHNRAREQRRKPGIVIESGFP